MSPDNAQTLALQAIAHICAQERLLSGLMALTGLDADALRNGLDDAAVQRGVLEFLLSDERALIDFCTAIDCPPDWPAQAQTVLAGGPVWQD